MIFSTIEEWQETLKQTYEDAFGVYLSKGVAHKEEWSKIVKAWNQCRLTAEAKQKVDAMNRAHGIPVSLLPADWWSLMKFFKEKVGDEVSDSSPVTLRST